MKGCGCMSKTEELVQELRRIQLELFRNAASLDMAITDVELFLQDNAEEEFKRLSVNLVGARRRDVIRICKYDKLDELEKDIWQQIRESMEES